MIRYKIKDVAFECNEKKGTAKVITPEGEECFSNAVEGWNSFRSKAMYPLEIELRNKLEANGFNRWTGTRKLDYTESELKAFDDRIISGELIKQF